MLQLCEKYLEIRTAVSSQQSGLDWDSAYNKKPASWCQGFMEFSTGGNKNPGYPLSIFYLFINLFLDWYILNHYFNVLFWTLILFRILFLTTGSWIKPQKMCYYLDDSRFTRSWSPDLGKLLTTWQLDSCEWNPPNNCHTQLDLSTISYTASHLCISLSSIDKELVAEISRWFSLLLFLLAPKMLKSMSRCWNGIFSSIFHFYCQSDLNISRFPVKTLYVVYLFHQYSYKEDLTFCFNLRPSVISEGLEPKCASHTFLLSDCWIHLKSDDNFKISEK